VVSSKAYSQLTNRQRILHSQVALPQNPSKYILMVSLVLLEAEGLQMLQASRLLEVDNYGNSVPSRPPVSAYPSNDIVCPEDQMPLLCLDVQPKQYHDVPVSTVNATGSLRERNASIDTIPVPLSLCILVLEYPSSYFSASSLSIPY
jgi:hypothetical protein